MISFDDPSPEQDDRQLPGSGDRTYPGVMVHDDGEIPAFVRALPAPFRRQVKAQCEGDWRRVTQDRDGSITVHNNPVDPDAPPPAPPPVKPVKSTRPPLIPELPPLPTPLWAKPPQLKTVKPVDTRGFARTVLPATGPPKKRVPKPSPPRQPVLEPPTPPVPAPPPEPILEAVTPFLPPAPATPPRTFEPVALPERKRRARRKGTPRTAKELLGRLLDLGCTYRRVPQEHWANVKLNGIPLGQVHTQDSTPRDVVEADYHAMRAAIEAMEGNS